MSLEKKLIIWNWQKTEDQILEGKSVLSVDAWLISLIISTWEHQPQQHFRVFLDCMKFVNGESWLVPFTITKSASKAST